MRCRWYGIIGGVFSVGLAFKKAPKCQIDAFDNAMMFYSMNSVQRATWLKAAGWPFKRGNTITVNMNQKQA
jgi:hypothetical protein